MCVIVFATFTQTVPKTLSPQWREQFDLHLYEESGGVLEITVWDRDTGRRDDFMGRSVVSSESRVWEFHKMSFKLKEKTANTLLFTNEFVKQEVV